MKEIIFNSEVIARYITQADIVEGLSFFSTEKENIQVGSWNYDSGKDLPRHIHNKIERRVDRTQEVLVVISGSIEATIYTLDQEEVTHLKVNAGEVLILLNSGHGYRILEDSTKVIEIKNGPYLGADLDRFRF